MKNSNSKKWKKIVARELKKPCIVGTKIATKVLKDEDLVEVNADKGVVEIIKT